MKEEEVLQILKERRPDLAAKIESLRPAEEAPVDAGMTVIGGEWPSLIEGSRACLCKICGGTISVSPRVFQIVAVRSKVEYICSSCAVASFDLQNPERVQWLR